jgi:hypothetical protein
MNTGRERSRNAYEEPNTISPRSAHRRKTKTSIRVFRLRRFSSGVFRPHSDRNTARTDARKQGRDDPSSLRAHSHLLPNGMRLTRGASLVNGAVGSSRCYATGPNPMSALPCPDTCLSARASLGHEAIGLSPMLVCQSLESSGRPFRGRRAACHCKPFRIHQREPGMSHARGRRRLEYFPSVC